MKSPKAGPGAVELSFAPGPACKLNHEALEAAALMRVSSQAASDIADRVCMTRNMPKLPSVPTKEPGGPDLTTPQTPQKQLLVPFGLGPDPKDPLCAGLGREIIMMPRMMPGSLGSLKFTSEGRLVTVWSRSRAKPPFTDWP